MFYLLLLLLYPLALLPLSCLYLLSDLLYILLFKVAGYRRQVTYDNLRHAFPEKNEEELHQIMVRFYHHFFDQVVELIKLLAISEKKLAKRVTGNWDVFKDLNDEGINTYALLGHTFNWEWANVACQYNSQQQFAGVYMPVKSKAVNKLMSRIRTRGGGWLISMKAKKAFTKLANVRYIVGLIADQNPEDIKKALWLPFMNREAPFFKGPEQLAKRNGAAVVFAGIRRVKRGYYEIRLELITKNAAGLTENEILQKYVAFMERQLREQPDNWMWTHKRWKHKKEAAPAKVLSPSALPSES